MSINCSDGEEDLQIEITANEPADLFAVMVTRADSRVESVVCVPSPRGRPSLRKATCFRPDPERFKSPIKDGRRCAMGEGRRDMKDSETTPTSSGVRFIHDNTDDGTADVRKKYRGQKFHIRIAYPNGFRRG